jgi:hypothetical protein
VLHGATGKAHTMIDSSAKTSSSTISQFRKIWLFSSSIIRQAQRINEKKLCRQLPASATSWPPDRHLSNMVLSSEVASLPSGQKSLCCASPKSGIKLPLPRTRVGFPKRRIKLAGKFTMVKEGSTCGGLDCWAFLTVTSRIGYCKDCRKEGRQWVTRRVR